MDRDADAREYPIPPSHLALRWFRLEALDNAVIEFEDGVDYIEVLEDIQVSCGPDSPMYPDWDIDAFARFFARLLRHSSASEIDGWLEAHEGRVLAIPAAIPEPTGDDEVDAEGYVRAIASALDVPDLDGDVDVSALSATLRRLIAPKREDRVRWPDMGDPTL